MNAVVYPFPPAARPAPVVPLSDPPHLTSPVPFGARPGLLDPRADTTRVAALLLALESEPMAAPMITTQHGLDRIGRVLVRLPSTSGVLTPCQARLAAATLAAEQAFAGCMGVAADLRAAADAADAAMPFRAERPWRSGGRTLLGLALLISLAAATAIVPYH